MEPTYSTKEIIKMIAGAEDIPHLQLIHQQWMSELKRYPLRDIEIFQFSEQLVIRLWAKIDAIYLKCLLGL